MFKIGIVGFGYMGNFHYEKIKYYSNQMELVCVYDISNEAKNKARAKNIEVCEYEEEFFSRELDLVVIATPNQWHAYYAIKAMKSQMNVIIEKPAVMNMQEMEKVIHCEEKTNKFVTVHHQRRHDMDYQIVLDTIKNKKIGNVTTIESRVMGERGVCFGWRADPKSGGGMLYDWGVHLVDQILMLFEHHKIHSIYARLISVLTPMVDDFCELSLEFDNKVCAHIVVTTFALEKLPRWFVYGDRGTLKVDDFSGKVCECKTIKKDIKGFDSIFFENCIGASRTMAPLDTSCIQNETLIEPSDQSMDYWKNIVEALENKNSPEVKVKDIYRVMQVIETAFLSNKEGRIIQVEI